MSYVGEPFAHDLFVSYSHGDDGSGNAFLKPWSVAFVAALEKELRTDRKFRTAFRIFLDGDRRPGQGVDPTAPLTEQLREEIKSAALLLILMTPDYLASSWCKDEREWWRAAQTALELPTEQRIAVIHAWPTEEEWPAELMDSRRQRLVGFPFFEKMASGLARPLGWREMPGPFGQAFNSAILDVIGRLYIMLDEMKSRLDERRRARTEAEKLAGDGGQTIYLHGRVDRKETWERAATALADIGIAVVPGEPDPLESDATTLQKIRERRVETMSGCDGLLLVGSDDGRALDADLVVIGKHDRHSARARTNRLIPCGLLDTCGAAVAT
ncbi:MAG: toll/interleukin-1 receptor domain-containing protein, partial [Alphaproteobacteria bacterium]|nr:toll/interleukin-1 receptor domain-containing protein [Alphaproteobacteria bacterium]